MKLSKKTQEVLKNFSTINSNILISPGKSLITMSAAKHIFAAAEIEEEFEHEVGIYNLSEFLGVLSLFNDPDIKFSDKFMTISEGKVKTKYVYADKSILLYPSKPVKGIDYEIEFVLEDNNLAQIQKAASVLAVQDVVFVGNGKKIIARVLDKANSSSNTYDIDLEAETTETFEAYFKIENFKFIADTYSVSLSSKKVAKLVGNASKVTYYVAAEDDSEFK